MDTPGTKRIEIYDRLRLQPAIESYTRGQVYLRRFLCLYFILLWLSCSLPASAQTAKKVIANGADLPEFTYAVPENPGGFLTSDAAYQPFAAKARADVETILRDYDVQDKKRLRYLKMILSYLDFEGNRFDEARERIRQVRELETPAEKLKNGDLFVMEAILKAFDVSGETSGAKFQTTFRQIFAEAVNALPDDLRAGVVGERDFANVVSAEYLVKDLTAALAPVAKQHNNNITLDEVTQVLAARFAQRFFLAFKDDIRQTYTAYLNSRKPVNIWTSREVVLTNREKLTPVLIGIWDSGVDSAVYPNQMFVNKREKLNGKDDDGNGFVDDIHGIAFDAEMKYTTDETFPLTAADVEEYPAFAHYANLDADIVDGIETAEVVAYKEKQAALRADAKAWEKYSRRWNFLGRQYMHGTEVAGVVVKGNPAARIVNARLTFRNKTGDKIAPTEDVIRRTAEHYKTVVAYFKSRKARVVNMSWETYPQEIEEDLEFYKMGANAAERKQMARQRYTILKNALFEAIKGAPEILFVSIAGNRATDLDATETIPSGFVLPNLLTVGAVDASGAKAYFSNAGKSVTLYGLGVNTETFAPGGIAVRVTGTSLAGPQVAGLAAKLFALRPKLTVAETIALIRQGADTSADGTMKLINPKKSVELLLAR